jgi:hypothetical protein
MSSGRTPSGHLLPPSQAQAMFFLHRRVDDSIERSRKTLISRSTFVAMKPMVAPVGVVNDVFQMTSPTNAVNLRAAHPTHFTILGEGSTTLPRIPRAFQNLVAFSSLHPSFPPESVKKEEKEKKKMFAVAVGAENEKFDSDYKPVNLAQLFKRIPLVRLKHSKRHYHDSLACTPLPTVPEHLPVTFHCDTERAALNLLQVQVVDTERDIENDKDNKDNKDKGQGQDNEDEEDGEKEEVEEDDDDDAAYEGEKDGTTTWPIHQQRLEIPLIANWHTHYGMLNKKSLLDRMFLPKYNGALPKPYIRYPPDIDSKIGEELTLKMQNVVNSLRISERSVLEIQLLDDAEEVEVMQVLDGMKENKSDKRDKKEKSSDKSSDTSAIDKVVESTIILRNTKRKRTPPKMKVECVLRSPAPSFLQANSAIVASLFLGRKESAQQQPTELPPCETENEEFVSVAHQLVNPIAGKPFALPPLQTSFPDRKKRRRMLATGPTLSDVRREAKHLVLLNGTGLDEAYQMNITQKLLYACENKSAGTSPLLTKAAKKKRKREDSETSGAAAAAAMLNRKGVRAMDFFGDIGDSTDDVMVVASSSTGIDSCSSSSSSSNAMNNDVNHVHVLDMSKKLEAHSSSPQYNSPNTRTGTMSVTDFFELQDSVTHVNSNVIMHRETATASATSTSTKRTLPVLAPVISVAPAPAPVAATYSNIIQNSSTRHSVLVVSDSTKVVGVELWRRLEHGGPRFAIEFVDRRLPEPLLMIIDAETGVCLIMEHDMTAVDDDDGEGTDGDGHNNSTTDRFQSLCDQLIRLSMSFETLWIIIDLKSRDANSKNVDTMPGSVASSNIQFMLKMQKCFVQISQSIDCCFKLRYICSSQPEGFDYMLNILMLAVEKAAAKRQPNLRKWLQRDYLGEIESDKERFLSLAVPGMNCFKAQKLLASVSFLECLAWHRESVTDICARHENVSSQTIEFVCFALAPPSVDIQNYNNTM